MNGVGSSLSASNRRSTCSSRVPTCDGNKPCRPKESRSWSGKAVPSLSRGELIRPMPASDTSSASCLSAVWRSVFHRVSHQLIRGTRSAQNTNDTTRTICSKSRPYFWPSNVIGCRAEDLE